MQTIHINLIGGQVLPNIIPTLSDRDCVDVVLFLGDGKEKLKAIRSETIYNNHKRIVKKMVEGKDSVDFEHLKEKAEELIQYLEAEHADKRWVLNTTGGTKLMSVALFEAFNEYNAKNQGKRPHPLIYTVTQGKYKYIQTLNKDSDFVLDYESNFNLDVLLLANGFTVKSDQGKKTWINEENDQDIRARAELTEFLCDIFTKDRRLLGTIQKIATKASEKFPDSRIQFFEKEYTTNPMQLDKLVEHGFIKWQENDHQIEFTSEFSCRYLSGLWLEEFTYLSALKCNFDEVAMSVEGDWDRPNYQQVAKKGKNNEFDVLIRHNNQLLTIECKARNWASKEAGESTKQDTIHKLANLSRDLGGSYNKSLLVSAHNVPEDMKNRAEQSKIEIYDQFDKFDLISKLKTLREQMD